MNVAIRVKRREIKFELVYCFSFHYAFTEIRYGKKFVLHFGLVISFIGLHTNWYVGE